MLKPLFVCAFNFFYTNTYIRNLLNILLVPGNLHTGIFLLYLLTVVLYKNILCGIHSEIIVQKDYIITEYR